MRDTRVPDLEDVDIADIPADFNSVQLFHSKSCFVRAKIHPVNDL